MSSSDDDWMPKSKPPGLTSTSTENSMMAARRRALQQKREQQQQQQQAQTNVSLLSTASTTSAAPPPAVKVRGRLGAQEEPPARESSLPTDIFGDSSSRPSTTASVTVAPRPTATAAVTSSMPHQQSLNVPTAAAAAAASSAPIEDVVESLRLQVETKKELLAAASKKEEALLERARAQKAKKLAETKLLDNQLQLVKDKANALTRSMEHEVEQARQQEEKRVEAARRKVEEEVRATYEASLAEVQAQIATAREEEQRLSGIVEGSGAARDAVTSAVTAALGKIVSKLPEMFSANSDVSTEWMDRLHQQVRHEVRSSFAVSAESDAQDERESYKKYFEELLKFWKDAEVSERERIAAMDDKLLSELDRVAQEDVERLRRQEMSMEEIYVQSREEWAVQHQKLLEIELSAAMKRRHTELEEQRALRLQLHEARIRDIEERHKDQLDLEEQWHARQMNQVRESFAKEDELQERRHKTVLSTQEIITQSMDSLQTVLGSMEGVFGSLKDYQQSVDHKRSDLEKERAAAITDHEALLTSLHESITTQSVAVESEREKANATLMQMQVLSQQLEQHLHNESSWLEQQERVYEGNRSEWEREYRSWTQLVQREKAVAEERFSGALTSLQRYVTLLGAEERELTVETEAMKRAFAEVSTKAEEEIDSIHATETDLEKRRLAMSELVTAMDEKRSAVGQQWRAIQEKRKKLAMDREQLTEDEGKLQQMMYALKLVSAQMEFARMEAASTAEHTRAVRHDLARSKEALGAAQHYAMGRSPPDALRMGPQHGANTSPVALNNADRLPTRVLQELQAQLDSAPSGGGPAPIALRSDRPARSPQRVTPPRRTKQSQAAAHTSRGPARHGEDRSPRATGTQRRHHYDPAHEPFPSSQPVTEARSSYHSQSQGREWTPTGNTFTNLAGFSDMEYT